MREVKLPSRIEDFTVTELNRLEDKIRSVLLNFSVDPAEIYLVGSICFGLESIHDVDLVVPATEEFSQSDLAQMSRLLCAEFGLSFDIKFIADWVPSWQRSDLGFLVPYYDLINRRLHNKEPGDTIPFNFNLTTQGQPMLITYDRAKCVRIKDHLKPLLIYIKPT
ncbi:hypothetical protein [Gracilimonas tropica]|uniref:hypothetical protein n=1 Tax=Gracilimonas tropica TaxID=454600 RepID=UPI000370CE20|nr:hypothetical protein [Gracilimonas tropica]